VTAREEQIDHNGRPRLRKDLRQENIADGIEKADPERGRALIKSFAQD
jgi:hypothetical protein